jgi:hypothetical protein
MPSTKAPTSAQEVQINGWFIESASGTPGTVPVNGTWKNIGIISTLNESGTKDVEEIPIVGSPDPYARVDMGNTNTFDMKYYMINNIEFLSYIVALQAGTGTPARAVNILQKQLIDNTTMWRLYRGCYPDSGTFNLERVPSVDVTYRATTMSHWLTTSELTTEIGASYVPPAALTDTPLTNLDAGTDPFSIDGVNFDVNRVTLGVNRNVREKKPLGNRDPTRLGVGNRRFTFSGEFWVEGNELYDFWNNFTANDAVIKFLLTPNVIQLNLTDVTFDDYQRGLDSGDNEFQLETLSGACQSATLTRV